MNEDRLNTLEYRLGSLEALTQALDGRLRRMENPGAKYGPPPIQQPQAQAPAPPKPQFQIPTPPPPGTPPPTNLPPRQPSAPMPPQPLDTEYQIGAQWLPRIGAGLTVLGIAYLIKLAVDHGMITPAMLFCGAIALCALFMGVGQWLRNEKEDFGQILTGIGSCGLFLTFAGGHVYQNLYSGETLVVLFSLWSAVNLGYAWLRESRSFWSIGLSGGLIAAWMPVSKDAYALSLGLHAFILIPALAIAVRHRWSVLTVVAWIFGSVSVLPICEMSHLPWQLRVLFIEGLAVVSAIAYVHAIKNDEAQENFLAIASMLGLSGIAGLFIHNGIEGTATVLTLSAICGALATAYHSRKPISAAFAWTGLGLAVLLAPLGLDRFPAFFAFATLSAAASIVSIVRKEDGWAVLGISQLVIAALYYLYSAFEAQMAVNTEAIWLIGLFIGAALAGATARKREEDPRWVLSILMMGFVVTRAAMVISGQPVLAVDSTASITIGWALYAVALLAAGFISSLRVLRYGGLTVVFLTVGKILAVDLATTAPEVRVGVLIGVGLALVAAGYWYIRRKSNIAPR